MRLFGMPDDILRKVSANAPEVYSILTAVRNDIEPCKREVTYYQAGVLYALAKRYNVEKTHILEIGTARGFSAAILARAATLADIVTLNPKKKEYPIAVANMARPAYHRVTVVQMKSWDYLAQYTGPMLDMVFVDGDHGKVAWDFPWWNWLKPGGLMLFHDYTPMRAGRPCQPAYEAIDALQDGLDRDFDVLVVDDDDVGMAGFYKREDERLPKLDVDELLWHFNEDYMEWRRGVGTD